MGISPYVQSTGLLAVVACATLFMEQLTAFNVCLCGLVVLGLFVAIDTFHMLTGGFDDIIDEMLDIELLTGEEML